MLNYATTFFVGFDCLAALTAIVVMDCLSNLVEYKFAQSL